MVIKRNEKSGRWKWKMEQRKPFEKKGNIARER